MNTRSLLAIASLALVAACSDTMPDPTEALVKDSYIVTVVDGVDAEVVAHDHGVVPHYVYTDALHGFAATMSSAKRDELLTDARVKAIEPDQIELEETTQSNATWGLDRIDQRALPLNTTYSYTSTGSGVTVYILDTSIFIGNEEFGGRASFGVNEYDSDNLDRNGHGTHVAGIVGGTTYGVGKAVKLVAVKVLGASGSGSVASVIAGVDWVTHNHAPNSIANMSLGGGASAAMDAAVTASIKSGVTYVLAAGNSNVNSCNYSPARVPEGITVGATDSGDKRASFSNIGPCLDIFAPGFNITAAWVGSATATKAISGTSMAAPYVAGVAALYLSLHPGATPQQVRDAIVGNATTGVVVNAGTGSPNALLFSNY